MVRSYKKNTGCRFICTINIFLDSTHMGPCGLAQGAELGALWWPTGVHRGWGGRETQEEGDICIRIADSLHCTAKTSNTIKQLYSNFLKSHWMENSKTWTVVPCFSVNFCFRDSVHITRFLRFGFQSLKRMSINLITQNKGGKPWTCYWDFIRHKALLV